MSDIVERLRAPLGVMKCEVSTGPAPENKLERRWLLALEAADEIEKLRVENIQMQAALGYAICAEDERHIVPTNPYRCGICDANKGLRDEIDKLRAALREAAMSDTEYCAEIERINKALIEAPTVDVDVVVPERDYSAMTPKDCYEAGLLDGVYQAREAIKAAARAALGGGDE